MKNLLAALLFLLSQNAAAQDQNQAENFWTKGFWAEFSLGANFLQQPDLSAAPLVPDVGLPTSNGNFAFRFGHTFRRRWGLSAMARQVTTRAQTGLFQMHLEKNYPDFFINNISAEPRPQTATHLLIGLHGLPWLRGRWLIEVNLMGGKTEIRTNLAAVELKKQDSNELIWLDFKPSGEQFSTWQYSTTWLAGLRGGYFFSEKIRLSLGCDLVWLDHRLKFERQTTWQIDQSKLKENVVLRQQQWLGGVSVGVVWQPDFSNWFSRQRRFRKILKI